MVVKRGCVVVIIPDCTRTVNKNGLAGLNHCLWLCSHSTTSAAGLREEEEEEEENNKKSNKKIIRIMRRVEGG